MALCRCRCLPCDFKPRLMQDFQRDVMFLPSHSWDIVSMVCYWARHFTLKFFTWLRWEWVPGRTEMVMCTISSMRRNGCRTVCSPWSWNDTRMNRTIDQGGKMYRSSDLISDYKPAPLPSQCKGAVNFRLISYNIIQIEVRVAVRSWSNMPPTYD